MIYYFCKDYSVAPRYEYQPPPANAVFALKSDIAHRIRKSNQANIMDELMMDLNKNPNNYIKSKDIYFKIK